MPGGLTAFIAALCYASSYLCVRRGQSDSDPGDHGLFPVLLVSACALVVSVVAKVLRNPAPLVIGSRQELSIVLCILAGIIGTCFGRMALYAAIARLGATRGVIIDMISPMVTFAAAIAFLGEKFRWSSLYGMFGIVFGMSLLMVEGMWFPSRNIKRIYMSGVLIALLAAFLQGIGHVFRKPSIASPISPTFAATLDIISALMIYVVLLTVTGRLKEYVRHYTSHVNLFFVAAGCLSAAAVLLFFSASSAIPVSHVSMIISIQPVIIALLSRILFANLEHVTWFTFASSAVITLSVIAISL